jgi:hypothetical protein
VAVGDLKAVFVDAWPVVFAAPGPVFILIIAALAAMWWLAKAIYKGQIEGIKAQIEARSERLALAAEQLQHMREDRDRLKDKLATMEAQIVANAPYSTLTTTSTSAKALVAKLGEWEDDIEHTLTATFKPHMVFRPVGTIRRDGD